MKGRLECVNEYKNNEIIMLARRLRKLLWCLIMAVFDNGCFCNWLFVDV